MKVAGLPKHTREFLVLIGCCLGVVSARAEPLRIVSPPGFEQEIGDDYGTIGDSQDYYRVQSLHPAAAFADIADLPPTHQWLLGFAMRPDEVVDGPVTTKVNITASLGVLEAEDLDITFANNAAGGLTKVFQGWWDVSTAATRPSALSPYDFDIVLHFDHAFRYDPNQGSLLFDALIIGGEGTRLHHDGQTVGNLATIANFTGITGTEATDTYTWLQVVQFIFAEPADVNGDLVVDVSDIDLLSSELRAGSQNLRFDLNNDGKLDQLDRTTWVQDERATWFGDADLDGEFRSGDLVIVLGAGEYEDDVAGNSSWGEGDWNADGDFTSADLVDALADGGYEVGPRPIVAAVPEPAARALAIIGLGGGWLLSPRRRRWLPVVRGTSV